MRHLVANNLFPSNTYIVGDDSGTTCLVIDPGLDEASIDGKIQELNLKPVAILATHGHFDHIAGVALLQKKYNIPFYLHEADRKIAQSANFFLKLAKIDKTIITPVPDYLFKGKHETLSIGSFNLDVYNFPGHSAGSCVIRYKNDLFSGDIMYKKGLGFNNFPGEDKKKLRDSILEIFSIFPDEALILPGHGESEYLGAIKKNNVLLLNFLEKATT